MLWSKAWLETRGRVWLGAILIASIFTWILLAVDRPHGVFMVGLNVTLTVVLFSGMVAGAGIAAQAGFRGRKGANHCAQWTVALPVTRFRLVAVRAAAGWLEMAAGIALCCVAMWGLFPEVRAAVTPLEMLEYAAVLAACCSVFHLLSVLLATFLNDLLRVYGTLIAAGVVFWLPSHAAMPRFADLFRAMGAGSPLLAHSVPWGAVAFSLATSAILFSAALAVVRTREY